MKRCASPSRNGGTCVEPGRTGVHEAEEGEGMTRNRDAGVLLIVGMVGMAMMLFAFVVLMTR